MTFPVTGFNMHVDKVLKRCGSNLCCDTGGKKAINPDLQGPFVPVVATGTNKAGLKAPAFSPGCLWTRTNGPPRG
jgi:hypothetical protein